MIFFQLYKRKFFFIQNKNILLNKINNEIKINNENYI